MKILKKYYLENKEIILVCTHPGGNNPFWDAFFITIDSNKEVNLSEEIDVSKGLGIIAKEGKILLDLQYNKGFREYVEYKNGKVIIVKIKETKPLKSDDCEYLYSGYEHIVTLKLGEKENIDSSLYLTMGATYTMNDISNQPGYRADNFYKLLERDNEDRKKIPYDLFKRITCGYETDEKIIANLLMQRATIPVKIDGYRKGTLTFNNSVYEGESIHDTPNGYGKKTYKSGNKYVGDFKNGAYHGEGTYLLE